jgi:hypothetical protein
MAPNTRQGASDHPRAQSGEIECVNNPAHEENRQPEMSQPFTRIEHDGREPIFLLVPDTGDDIVVSRIANW